MKATIFGISLILVIVAALNHGLIALFGLDIIAALLGFSPLLIRVIYTLVGIAGVYLAVVMKALLAFFKINH